MLLGDCTESAGSQSWGESENRGEATERPRVLVIDDERGLRELLEYGLGQAGFEVRCVTEGSAALPPLLSAWPPDVIVLDVMLPDADGFALLPEIRRLTTAPVVMLTARTEVSERVAGLSAGADDYVGKPFDLEELIARLHTLMRRPAIERRDTLTYADLSIDTPSRTVYRGETGASNSPPASSTCCASLPSTPKQGADSLPSCSTWCGESIAT